MSAPSYHYEDRKPAKASFLEDVLAGLSSSPKTLPPKYFYDERGSRLFDRICELPEYYPTRTELGMLKASASEIAARVGPDAAIVEYGSGSGTKTAVLVEAVRPLRLRRDRHSRRATAARGERPCRRVPPRSHVCRVRGLHAAARSAVAGWQRGQEASRLFSRLHDRQFQRRGGPRVSRECASGCRPRRRDARGRRPEERRAACSTRRTTMRRV